MLCRFKRKENKADSIWTGMGIVVFNYVARGVFIFHSPFSLSFVKDKISRTCYLESRFAFGFFIVFNIESLI